MNSNNYVQPAEFIEAHWDEIVADIGALVSIPSVSNPTVAQAGAPFGPRARRALDAAVGIAQRMGFAAQVDNGYVGFCDVPGASATQLGVIAHVDVVPAGPGWLVEPYALTQRDGYLLGRGVSDDKGPLVLSLWALAYWAERYDVQGGGALPHPVRFIFGSSEEDGMADVEYYRAHHADPAFLFTPDAEFPVCYGEKGMYGAIIRSNAIPASERAVKELDAGTVPNAVPGTAYALVDMAGEGPLRIECAGKSAHASTPELGESALRKLLDELLSGNVPLCDSERSFFELARLICDDFHGCSLGLACEDEAFGALTGVAGTLKLDGDVFELTYDVRYPTAITGTALEHRLLEALAPWAGLAHMECVYAKDPFLVDAQSAPVQALLAAFNEVTGQQAQPFTMGGGTYARAFSRACSFGAEMPWLPVPSWVGGMHAPNEGVSIEQCKMALRIYIEAFGKLFDANLA